MNENSQSQCTGDHLEVLQPFSNKLTGENKGVREVSYTEL